MSVRVLGAPGVYRLPDEPVRSLTGVRLDRCAFVGVAPRGPAREPVFRADWAEPPCGVRSAGRARAPRSRPVAIESWDAYRRVFGGFEGPGLLPYAVAAFFENGGRRAIVVRVVHDYGDARDDEGVAEGAVPGVREVGGAPLRLRARSEGAWGNRLSARLTLRAHPLAFDHAAAAELALAPDAPVGVGALLRLTLPGGERTLRTVSAVVDDWRPATGQRLRRALLDAPLVAAPVRAEVVEAELAVDDGDGRAERHARMGLSPGHPRWMAAVLYRESALVFPHPEWASDALSLDDPLLVAPAAPAAPQFSGGLDRWADIAHEDFFDARWVPGDECPGDGVHALAEEADLGLLVVPDLYSPGPLAPAANPDPVPLAGPTFGPCVPFVAPPLPTVAAPELEGLRLDPSLPADFARVVHLQGRLVELADQLRTFVVLLDVPPGLNERRILEWRARFGSDFAAAYHPWLLASRREDRRGALVRVNPSAVAAGVIARRELTFGVQVGPANELATGVVDVAEGVPEARHDALHPAGINVYLREPGGVRLSAARTLSQGPEYRQLSVRRLVTMILRTVEQQMQWTVFEPNGASLRADVRHMLRLFLRQLYRANAFRGATEDEAFFVRCDDALNPGWVIDRGLLVAEVGIAPAEPLEFIVLRLAREGDGTLRLEA